MFEWSIFTLCYNNFDDLLIVNIISNIYSIINPRENNLNYVK